jgi:DNA polymerase III subunit alpha
MSFVHLHCHSEGSLLDGMCRVRDMVVTAREMGMPAVALTDHGVMYNAIEFYQRAKDAGVKPILGCEVYVAPGSRTERQVRRENQYYHMVLLARDMTGYKNLVKLVSKGFLEGFYYKPRVDKELLAAHAEGLIATSACLGGEIPEQIMAREMKKAEYLAGQFREIFGAGNFYLELQNHGIEEQKAVNEGLVTISQHLDLPLVCTNDVHYLRKEDAKPHEVLLCIQTGTTMNSPKRLRYGSDEFYLASPEVMRQRFSQWPSAAENTLAIAERCNVEFDFSKFHLPHYEVPPGYTYESYMEHLCREALEQRYGKITPEIEARLQYELEVIQGKGYAAYFLIVWDFVRYARSVGIMSQARGSAAGSLVSYLLGLTVIDPIRYGLLFERFLTRERKSMPDIDLDFADDRREEVIQYCRDKYGEDKVAQIITFGTMAAKAAVRDAGRALDIPIPEVDRVAKLIPTTPGMTLETALQQSPELARMAQENPIAQQLITTAKSVEGLYRHASTHAAAVVITREPVVEYAPVQRIGESGVTIQFSKDHCEKIGLLKMDFLGLRNLTVVDKCLKLIERTRGVKIDLETLPLDDAPTYRLLQAGESVAVFQLESSGMQKLLRDLKPDKLEDIIALVALYRPGPLGSGMTEEYCRRKHGLSPARYPHPSLEPILKDTYGIILYQEQVMKISMVLAGFSAGQAEDLMKAMSKKKVDAMEKLKPAFLAGAKEHGVDATTAQEIYDVMFSFASYGFGLNHSAAYAVLTYQTAYLKANYPAEFMATNCSSIMDNKERLALYIDDIRRMGLAILPPAINESEADFTVERRGQGSGARNEGPVDLTPALQVPDAVRFGMAAIKNVSRNAIDAIVRARVEGGAFRSLTDFARRVYGEADAGVLTKTALECLIKAGAFDSLEPRRAALLAAVEPALGLAATLRRNRSMGQESLFGEGQAAEDEEEEEVALPVVREFGRDEALRLEKDLLGVYVSDHPLTAVAAQFRRQGVLSSEELKEQGDRVDVTVGGIIAGLVPRTTKKGQPMASVTLEDLTGTMPVTVFPKAFEEYARVLEKDRIVLIKGKTSIRERVGAVEEDEATGIVEVHADEIIPYNAPIALPTHEPAVHVRLARARPADLTLLRTLASSHPGSARLLIHVPTTAGEERVVAKLMVAASPKLVEALQSVVGRGEAWVE